MLAGCFTFECNHVGLYPDTHFECQDFQMSSQGQGFTSQFAISVHAFLPNKSGSHDIAKRRNVESDIKYQYLYVILLQ